jgi:hypothetical protein
VNSINITAQTLKEKTSIVREGDVTKENCHSDIVCENSTIPGFDEGKRL